MQGCGLPRCFHYASLKIREQSEGMKHGFRSGAWSLARACAQYPLDVYAVNLADASDWLPKSNLPGLYDPSHDSFDW